MSSSNATVVQSTSKKQSAINAVQQLLVENTTPMSDVITADSPSGTGNIEIKSEKKTRAPKKSKPTVDNVIDVVTDDTVAIDGEAVVTDANDAKPEKKSRAPKKVKPTIDNVVVDNAKPEKKQRASKKVQPKVEPVVVVENAVEPVVVVENAVEPVVAVENTKSEKKTRPSKKDKTVVDSKNDTNMIIQFIDKVFEKQIINKETYSKLHNELFPNKSISTIENNEQSLTKSDNVAIECEKSDTDDDEVESEIEEELVTTEYVHKGVLYLKDAEDNLYSRNPPHEFVLNLLE